MKTKHIVFLVPYPFDIAPGQRFRYEQYLEALRENDFSFEIFSFLDEKTNRILYKKGNTLQKVWGVLKGYFKRLFHIWAAQKADFVFIYREATPLGAPWVEWFLAKILRKKIIYDFDDAIWIETAQTEKKTWKHRLRNAPKVKKICVWSYKISVGNAFLKQNAETFVKAGAGRAQVILNPTTIDTVYKHNLYKNQTLSAGEKIVIVWTGSHSTLLYLDLILPILAELEQEFDFIFRVICDKNPNLPLKNFEFCAWNAQTEIEDLVVGNIGLMPLKTDAWSEGKCGFKALQYLALGIPAIVSPVGVNCQIVQQGQTGFWATTSAEWKQALQTLMQDANLRTEMGRKGRELVEKRYSVQANTANFLSLFTTDFITKKEESSPIGS
ncbi:glycosyltransferase [Hugenholtzia roseola]|uniref:glycosyltransferase n=1 Tax=Hugenholtzia roseola TaxID=1002 RepID=UPI00040B07B6|nr:glycosyltransferase [Hugenholtzia roseola]